jgi:hypothetical protein
MCVWRPDNPRCHSLDAIYLIFDTLTLTDLEFTKQDGWPVNSTCLPTAGITYVWYHVPLWTWVLPINVRSPYLCMGYLSNWTTSLLNSLAVLSQGYMLRAFSSGESKTRVLDFISDLVSCWMHGVGEIHFLNLLHCYKVRMVLVCHIGIAVAAKWASICKTLVLYDTWHIVSSW